MLQLPAEQVLRALAALQCTLAPSLTKPSQSLSTVSQYSVTSGWIPTLLSSQSPNWLARLARGSQLANALPMTTPQPSPSSSMYQMFCTVCSSISASQSLSMWSHTSSAPPAVRGSVSSQSSPPQSASATKSPSSSSKLLMPGALASFAPLQSLSSPSHTSVA